MSKLIANVHVQDGLGRVEFGIYSARKDPLGRSVAYAESYNSQCHWVVSTVDRSEQPPVPEECVGNGWRSITFNQPVSLFCSTSIAPCLTRDCRGIGELVTRITYADALSKEEVKDLIRMNEEAIRHTSEAVAKVYLVNIFPIRRLLPMPIKPLIQLLSTSQIYSFLGTRRRIPAPGCPYQTLVSYTPP